VTGRMRITSVRTITGLAAGQGVRSSDTISMPSPTPSMKCSRAQSPTQPYAHLNTEEHMYS
jgi:hypothetical protein